MPTRGQKMWCFASIVLGLLALYLLWARFTDVAMTFSGPSYIHTYYGLLGWKTEKVDYDPQRVGASLGDTKIAPPELKPNQEYWDHHGEFGDDVVILTQKNQESTFDPLALAATVVLSLVVLWFAVLGPMRKLSRRSAPAETTAA
jgi:hypothetical protein